MAVLCRDFDISRKTGYKIFQRYKDCGLVPFANPHSLFGLSKLAVWWLPLGILIERILSPATLSKMAATSVCTGL